MKVETFWEGGACRLRLDGQVFPKSAAYVLEQVEQSKMPVWPSEFLIMEYSERRRLRDLLKEAGLVELYGPTDRPRLKARRPESTYAIWKIQEALEQAGALQADHVLEKAARNAWRCRLFYGDTITGQAYITDSKHSGTIHRGENACYCMKTRGKEAIITRDSIVMITKDRKPVYKHPSYHTGLEVEERPDGSWWLVCKDGGENRLIGTSARKADMVSLKNFHEGITNRVDYQRKGAV